MKLCEWRTTAKKENNEYKDSLSILFIFYHLSQPVANNSDKEDLASCQRMMQGKNNKEWKECYVIQPLKSITNGSWSSFSASKAMVHIFISFFSSTSAHESWLLKELELRGEFVPVAVTLQLSLWCAGCKRRKHFLFPRQTCWQLMREQWYFINSMWSIC